MKKNLIEEIGSGTKSSMIKKKIINHYIYHGNSTITELSKKIELSVPTVTKFIMEMCDKLGIVTSVEIPVINAVTETEAFLDNSVNMAVEMVRQDFNQDMYYRLVVGEDDTYNMIVWNDDSDEITVYQFRKEGELYHLIQFFQSTTITKEDVVGKEDGVISIDSGSR